MSNLSNKTFNFFGSYGKELTTPLKVKPSDIELHINSKYEISKEKVKVTINNDI